MLTLPHAAPRSLRRSRRSQRGAALVEAAFMMPMFVILWFTSLYAHNLNATQLTLNIETRAQAWAYTMMNCSGAKAGDDGETPPRLPGGPGAPSKISLFGQSGNDTASAAGQALSTGSVSGAISNITSSVTSAISSILPNPAGAQSQVEDSLNWRQPNIYSGDDPKRKTNVRQTTTLVCNEKPQDGTIGAALMDIICAITGKGC